MDVLALADGALIGLVEGVVEVEAVVHAHVLLERMHSRTTSFKTLHTRKHVALHDGAHGHVGPILHGHVLQVESLLVHDKFGAGLRL